MSIWGINNNNNVVNVGSVNTLPNINVTDENANGLNALKSMTSGETFEGQVVGIEGDVVSVKVADNAVINARLDAAMGLIEGQTVIFQVQSGSDNSIALRPLFTNMAQEQIANNALNSASLPVNSTTLSLVSNLMNEGMSIDKNSIMNIYRDIMANPEAAVDKLVHMTKLGLEITPESVEQYDTICNLKDSFSNAVDTIVNEIPTEINNMIAQGDSEAATALMKDCIAMIAGGIGEEVAQTNDSEAATLSQAGQAIENEAIAQTEENVAKSPEEMLKALMTNVVMEEEVDASTNPSKSLAAQSLVDTAQNMEALLETIKGNPELAKGLNITDTTTLNPDQLFAKLNEAINNGDISDKQLAALIKNDDFSALFKSELKDTWLLEPKDLEKSENVNEFYNRLNAQIHSIASSMEQVLGGNENLNQSINQLNQNLQFLDQLSHMMPYVQLPLKMNGEAQTGDLYVYANKKNLMEGKDNISALLRLDMKYLGFMEVFVKLEGTNNVTTDFCMEREDVIDFLEKNMDQLTSRLEDRGYNLNANVRHKDVKENISKEFATNGTTPGGAVSTPSTDKKIGHFRFDVRA